ncbi:L,D-transpeptidase [Lacisediminihabitans sp.]|uniref:L,D-transpeptidase n=1 Tax=Lacisediminihabitans sp. TaxID=2787631 RepID=UPI002F92CFAC
MSVIPGSRRWILIAAAAVVVVSAVVAVAVTASPSPTAPTAPPSALPSTPAPVPTATGPAYTPPDAAALAALPDANYDAVIPGLLDAAPAAVLPIRAETFTLKADLTPLYGADRSGPPVASLPFLNFLGSRTVVAPVVVHDGEWTQILTPSRRELPSTSSTGVAASQTMAWVRTDQLVGGAPVLQHVLVRLGAGTLSIVNTADGAVTASYPIGVGKAATATPVGVSYLEARYSDPKQVVGHSIYLTGAHSAVADHPFGPDQGLVGIHWSAVHDGAVSHACIRLDTAGDIAMAKIAVGSPVLVVP